MYIYVCVFTMLRYHETVSRVKNSRRIKPKLEKLNSPHCCWSESSRPLSDMKAFIKSFHMRTLARLTGRPSRRPHTNWHKAGAVHTVENKAAHFAWWFSAPEADGGVCCRVLAPLAERVLPVLPGIPSDQSSGTSSPLCDSGLHLNYHPNNTVRARRCRESLPTAVFSRRRSGGVPTSLRPLCCVSAGHAVLLVLAHVSGAALGEEMGGPAPHSAAALPHVAVHPGVWLLQVSSGTAARRYACFGRLVFFVLFFGGGGSRCLSRCRAILAVPR